MKRLRWALAAADDLDGIAAYLKLHHPEYATATFQRIYNKAKRLKQFPKSGREGRIEGTRELVLSPLPYLLIYSVTTETVNVLRILHTSRDPRQFSL
jgi:addiction module RelE/StbE family toxin